MTPLSVSVAVAEPGYDSFQEAIAASQRSSRAIAARDITRTISRATIKWVRAADTTLDLLLTNQMMLSIYLANSIVCWSLQPVASTDGWVSFNELPHTVLPLLYPHSPEPEYWDRSEIASSLEGQELVRVCAGETWFCLDVKGQPSLMFFCLNVDEGKQLLHYGHE